MRTYKELLEHLIRSGVLHSPHIIRAFETTDRALFVPEELQELAYSDEPLPIGYAQTISQPSTVAFMLELLDPQSSQHILDIGSGSGWTTALLARIVGENGFVTGLERIDALVAYGNENLKRLGITNAKIHKAGKELGIPGERFDRILVSAAATELPLELPRQLKEGGKLVIPVQNSIFELKKNTDGTLILAEHVGFRFVPLVT